MKKTKVFSALLIVVMLISVLAGCASNNQENGQSSNSPEAASNSSSNDTANANSTTKDPYEITMAMPVFGAVPKDIELVQSEINKITQSKINATVKLLPISIGAWQQQMNLMTSGGEKLDLYFSFGQGYGSDVAAGKILPLDELLEKYGQELTAQFEPEYLNAAKMNGKIYGVPVLKEFTTGQQGILMRKDLVDKYKIDVSAIHSIDDLDQVFATIKQNEPTITPLFMGLSGLMEKYLVYDPLGDGYGVLPDYDNGLKVENIYDTKWYEDTVTKIHSWFKAGYINKDAANSKVTVSEGMKAGNVFSYIIGALTGGVENEKNMTGKDMVFVPLLPNVYSTTNNVTTGLWTISQNSTNPERTMMFMNLMYSDPAIANLLMWGVEGKHYVKTADNMIDYPQGVTRETVGWTNQVWLIGNGFNTYLFKGEMADKWTVSKEMNKQAIKSKALGFSFNPEPVKNELTAVSNVNTQYGRGLQTGTLDPEKNLADFRSKLKSAGIERVIAEKQKQLDAWAAANK